MEIAVTKIIPAHAGTIVRAPVRLRATSEPSDGARHPIKRIADRDHSETCDKQHKHAKPYERDKFQYAQQHLFFCGLTALRAASRTRKVPHVHTVRPVNGSGYAPEAAFSVHRPGALRGPSSCDERVNSSPEGGNRMVAAKNVQPVHRVGKFRRTQHIVRAK